MAAILAPRLLLIMLILNACETTPYPIDYQLLDTNRKYRTTVKRDANSYEELISKGSVLRTDFVRFDNNRYFEMEMDLYTLQKYNTIKIHSLEFEFDGQKRIINVNRTISFVDYSFKERIFIVEDHDDLNLMVYSVLIECFINNSPYANSGNMIF
jgi:hypothetical protein